MSTMLFKRLSSSARAYITTQTTQRLCGRNNWGNISFWRLEVQDQDVGKSLVSPEASLLTYRWLLSHCVLLGSLCVPIFSSYKTTESIGLGLTLPDSFNLIISLKFVSSNNSHILGTGVKISTYEFGRGHNSAVTMRTVCLSLPDP